MKSSFHYLVVSIMTIALGAGWLLNLFSGIPNVHWIWTLGTGLAGLLILALCGISKLTIVTGPFLIIASIFSVMQQSGKFDLNQLMPSLMLSLGVLMLISQFTNAPAPGWANSQQ